MEFQYYCDELSKYYGLFVNESIVEVKDHLRQIISFYLHLLCDLALKEDGIDPFIPL